MRGSAAAASGSQVEVLEPKCCPVPSCVAEGASCVSLDALGEGGGSHTERLERVNRARAAENSGLVVR